ncbi:MAG: glucuronate isomerase [Armatimonadota bacterium]
MSAATESGVIASEELLRSTVRRAVADTPVLDVHTHIYSADFGDLLLWGVDELLTYHYLIAEVSRNDPRTTPEQFYAMSPQERANHIWRRLYLEGSPISEAQRGPLTTLQALGIDVSQRDLAPAREYFRDVTVHEHIDTVFRLANVSAAVMTNDPFDEGERATWEGEGNTDPRFLSALRIDGLLVFWRDNVGRMQGWGYEVSATPDARTCVEVRRFLADWIERMKPVYMAVSLPDTFRFPDDRPRSRLITEAVLPVCEERGIPFAMMIGVKRAMNPALQLAGDGVGKFDITVLERMCVENPGVRFLVTLLSRENQHELAVAARKFPNLMPFGCWWFLNNPSIIEEITRMRLELLGLSFIPQHSDARILDQLIYKWKHFREIFTGILADKYADLMRTGWRLTPAHVERDVKRLFSGNFEEFAHLSR